MMPKTTLTRKISAALSLVFSAARQQADHKKLNRHILALNQKHSSKEIIDEVSSCLKAILDYRLFAFAFHYNKGAAVWLDPRMYRNSLESIILTDFNLSSSTEIEYINQTFDKNETGSLCDMDQLVSYDISESNCNGRIYLLPSRSLYPYHDEIIQIIMKSAGVALSRQMAIENLKEAAVTDPLTGCYNRREFENHLNRQMAIAARHKTSLSVFMFDLDHFKQINDTHGHLAGDLVLKKVSVTVKDNMRAGDILARYGGEEFIAILPQTSKSRAIELADRLREIIASLEIRHEGSLIKISASFGVARFIPNADMNKLIQDADTMLYKAKLNGRNRVMPGLIKLCSTCSPQKSPGKAGT